MRVTISRRRHRLHDVASVFRMVVAVKRDELFRIAWMLIRREEALSFDQFGAAHIEALKKLLPLVELERVRMFLFVNHIWTRSRGHHHRSRRELDDLAG